MRLHNSVIQISTVNYVGYAMLRTPVSVLVDVINNNLPFIKHFPINRAFFFLKNTSRTITSEGIPLCERGTFQSRRNLSAQGNL